MLLVKYATLYRKHKPKQELSSVMPEAAAKNQTPVLGASRSGPKH